MINKEEELRRITSLKTIMMFLVVFYHVLLALQRNGYGKGENSSYSLFQGLPYIVMWLNSFHIQTFTFVSGYLFYMIRYEKKGYREISKDIVKRWMRLMFPFYAVSLLWAIPAEVFEQGFSWSLIIKNFLLAISPAQLWFLPMLFWIYLVFYLFSDVIEKIPVSVILGLYAIVYLGKIFLNRYIPMNILQISVSIEYLLYYYLGFLFRKSKIKKYNRVKDFTMLLIAVVLEIIYLWLWIQVKNRTLIDVIQPVVCGFQVIAVVTLGRLFKVERLSGFQIYQKISKNSMGIYLFHQQILYLTRSFFESFPPVLFVLLNFIVVFFISYGMTTGLRKIKIGQLVIGEYSERIREE